MWLLFKLYRKNSVVCVVCAPLKNARKRRFRKTLQKKVNFDQSSADLEYFVLCVVDAEIDRQNFRIFMATT